VILQLVDGEVFRRSLERHVAPGAEKPGHLQQPTDVLFVIPAIELGLEFGVDIGPHH
jgi:hypothetical protein